jgi:hypothetical protein
LALRTTTTPPPRAAGTWQGKTGSTKAAFNKEKAMAIVVENPDLLTYEEKDGKFTVKTKKFLDKEWEPITNKFREAGMTYNRDAKAWLPTQ